ncbi:hypothetical protein jhhlp_001577 [Lomentospora prolificans]|uniref:Amino acid transporter n=1 Tax=Lomentospora prolificans TaxID=41688 RepID=A0A2N3NIK9_9PEZI|nr:hypothetical protein jhhlp_001577 [Lomentospora prolificans]
MATTTATMTEKRTPTSDEAGISPVSSEEVGDIHTDNLAKEPFHKRLLRHVMTPGHAIQIVIAAALAIAIGMAVVSTVDEIPDAAPILVGIPGTLWLRALKAIVLPLIVTAMILAVQRLREMRDNGGKLLAGWCVGYYVLTTLLAIVVSCILTSLVWLPMFTVVGDDSLALDNISEKDAAKTEEKTIPEVVLQMFESFIPSNVVNALATDSLLAVLIMSIIVGYLIDGPTSAIYKVVVEVEGIITKIITWLIKAAPVGVFFLILPNLFKLNLADIGQNLGILMGCSLSSMGIHIFIVLPIIFFLFTRKNPYAYWFKCSPAWITAWGTASSAATLSVTLKCAKARGVPHTVVNFAVPLGCLINMDGTAIYFPACVVFLAATQGHVLRPTDYVIIVLLSTLASIGTTPIPSSSLVLTVMIAQSVNVPLTGMFAVIIAIDWFIDRFRTALNVSGDLYAANIIAKMTGIQDQDSSQLVEDELPQTQEATRRSDDRV